MIHEKLKSPREYMELTYQEMLKSVPDNDRDKNSPYVAALVVFPDGSYQSAHRCHTRDGHHAEESLIDDFNKDTIFDDAELYITLEPCVPESRSSDKTSCAERICNARIKKVYLGMLDPNPKIHEKGLKYLFENGVAVQMFDKDISKKIEDANKEFSNQFGTLGADEYLKIEEDIIDRLSEEAIRYYCNYAGLNIDAGYGKFWDRLIDYEILKKDKTQYTLSLDGYLAFAKNTIKYCDSAVMQLLVRFSANTILNTTGRMIEFREDYSGPGILIIEKLLQWAEKYIIKEQDRTQKNTVEKYIVPFPMLKEAVINSVVHRDYNLSTGAFNQFFISDEYISISNPTSLNKTSLENLNAFRSRSDPPNPRLARLFLEAHLMERSGSGMYTFSTAVPKPIYDYTDSILSLKFGYSLNNTYHLLREKYGGTLTETDFELYEFIRNNGDVTRKRVEVQFNISSNAATYRINRLLRLKMIQRVGNAKSRNNYYTLV